MSLAQQTLEFVSELISDRSSLSKSIITGGLYAFLSCSVLRTFRMSSLKGNFSLFPYWYFWMHSKNSDAFEVGVDYPQLRDLL